MTETGLKLIGEFRELEELHLDTVLSVTDSVITTIASGCRKLRYVLHALFVYVHIVNS